MYGLHKGPELSFFALESDARRADSYLSVGTFNCLQFHCARQGAIGLRERLSS